MHVVKFLLDLCLRVDVEIIIAALPEAAEFTAPLWKAKHKLPVAFAFSGAQGSGDSLLETPDDLCGSYAAGLAQNQMHVFGHEHIANKSEAVARSSLFEGADGEVAGANGIQKRTALVAAKSDEMKIIKTGDASQNFSASGRRGAHPFQNRKGRPPRRRSLLHIDYRLQVSTTVTC